MELEEEGYGPYDNVEFPARPPAASAGGTWPRSTINSGINSSSSSSMSSSSSAATSGGSNKLFGQHSLRTTGPRLAPLIEVDPSVSDGGDTTASKTGTRIIGVNANNTSSSASSANAVTTSGSNTGNSNTALQANQIHGNTTAATDAVRVKPSTQTTIASAASTTPSSASTTSSTLTPNPSLSASKDESTHFSTHITPSSDTLKKKNSTYKQLSADEEDFKRHDLNPGSRLALERVYICHQDFYQLNSKILDEGSLLKQDVNEIYRKSGESMTYEQLLQGMLIDGERFLLGGNWLYFCYVQFLDVEGTKILREPYRRGRIGLTSKRALFLSTETFTDASLEPYGDNAKSKDGGFKLEVSKLSNVLFKNIPLTNFHSAEMEVVTGTSAQTKITKKAPACCGLFARAGKWLSTPPMTRSISSRVLRVGVSMPPWQTRMFMDIHLDPSMSLTVARDFISQLHQFAPHMS